MPWHQEILKAVRLCLHASQMSGQGKMSKSELKLSLYILKLNIDLSLQTDCLEVNDYIHIVGFVCFKFEHPPKKDI